MASFREICDDDDLCGWDDDEFGEAPPSEERGRTHVAEGRGERHPAAAADRGPAYDAATASRSDPFDALHRLEERAAAAAFEAGWRHGQARGHEEGLRFGRSKGREVGAEIGFYREVNWWELV